MVLGLVLLSSRFPRSAAVFSKSFVFSSLTYKEGFGFAFCGGRQPSASGGFSFFSVICPQARRSYYLFFTTC